MIGEWKLILLSLRIIVKGNKQLKENMGFEIRDNIKYLVLNYAGRGSIWRSKAK